MVTHFDNRITRCMSHACLRLRIAIGGSGGRPRRRFWGCVPAPRPPAERWEPRSRAQGPADPHGGGNASQGEAAGGQGRGRQGPHRRRTGSPRVSGPVATDRKASDPERGKPRPQGRGPQSSGARARQPEEVPGRRQSSAGGELPPAGARAAARRQQDAPERVIFRVFDPVRREVARVALNKLIVDRRSHPARIEEIVAKSRQEVLQRVKEEGEAAVLELGLQGLHPEVVRHMGILRFRTSYGQQVLNHSKEVAHLAAMMASEIGADVRIAKLSGLLHDIGKAIDHEVEGSHAVIGADLLQRHGVPAQVVHAVRAHHYDEEPHSIEALLLIAADAISAARPGARRESLEAYVKRLEKLEGSANSLQGVQQSYAIQAGREVRILVKPEQIDDSAAQLMARDIAKRIESELSFPGQIRVTVVRETRAVEYAK